MTERKALFTDRLRLEPTGPDHADGLIAAKERSIEELRPWLAWAGDEDPDSIRAFVHACEQEWDVSEWTCTILLDGEVIGAVGVNRFDPMVSTANVGYWLRTDVAGRSLMTEAAAAVVEFAFGELGLHRLELTAAPDNVASVRVAEKLGFTRGGVLRDGLRGPRAGTTSSSSTYSSTTSARWGPRAAPPILEPERAENAGSPVPDGCFEA